MPRPFFLPRAAVLGAPLLALALSGCTVVQGNSAMSGASLRVFPETVVLAPGQTQTVMLDLSTYSQAGPGPYSLSVSPLPGVLTLSVNPTSLQSQGRAYLTLKAAEQAQGGPHTLTVAVTDAQGKSLYGQVQVFLGQDRPTAMPFFPSF